MTDEKIIIKPQPRNGPPFRLAEGTQGQRDGDWWNESLGWRHFRGPLLFHWQCPFGKDGEPRLIDGVWYWVKKQRWRSIAVWPNTIKVGNEAGKNESDDIHESREAAQAVCDLLQRHGFGGDCKVFPVSTRVEPVEP